MSKTTQDEQREALAEALNDPAVQAALDGFLKAKADKAIVEAAEQKAAVQAAPAAPKRQFGANSTVQRIPVESPNEGAALRDFLAQYEADAVVFDPKQGWVYVRQRALAVEVAPKEETGEGKDGLPESGPASDKPGSPETGGGEDDGNGGSGDTV